MIRYIRYIFLVVLGVILVTVALANRGPVTVRLIPVEISDFFGWTSEARAPLYIVIYGGIVAGLLIGFLWEWFREWRLRAEADRAKREVTKLENEVKQLKGQKKGSQDDVLALLE